jgi:hypothetical protein
MIRIESSCLFPACRFGYFFLGKAKKVTSVFLITNGYDATFLKKMSNNN